MTDGDESTPTNVSKLIGTTAGHLDDSFRGVPGQARSSAGLHSPIADQATLRDDLETVRVFIDSAREKPGSGGAREALDRIGIALPNLADILTLAERCSRQELLQWSDCWTLQIGHPDWGFVPSFKGATAAEAMANAAAWVRKQPPPTNA